MGQTNDGNLHRFSCRRPVGLRQLRGEGILVVDIKLHKGHHAYDRNAAPLFQHDDSGIQNALVSPELIDDKPLEQCLLVRLQQHLRAQELGKNAATVDIAGQQNRCADRFCKSHIDNVVFFQIDLRRASSALDHDDIVFRRQRFVCLQYHGHEAFFISKVFARVHITQDLALHDDLGTCIGRGF